MDVYIVTTIAVRSYLDYIHISFKHIKGNSTELIPYNNKVTLNDMLTMLKSWVWLFLCTTENILKKITKNISQLLSTITNVFIYILELYSWNILIVQRFKMFRNTFNTKINIKIKRSIEKDVTTDILDKQYLFFYR